MANNISKVKKHLLKHKQFDGLLISKSQNIKYITGYHGSDAWLLLTPKTFYVITDTRYTEEAEKFFEKIPSVKIEILTPREGRGHILNKIIKKHRLKNLGIEMMDLVYGIAIQISDAIKPKKMVPVNGFVESLRMIKSKEEIATIRKSVALDEKVFSYLKKIIKPGVSEISLRQKVENRMKDLGGDGPSYPTIIASSWKAALPHAVSDSHKVKKNDILLVDMGTTYKGYVSDLTRTFFTGRMPSLFKDRYSKVLEAQELAISSIKPGLPIGELEQSVRKYFQKYNYSHEFCHSLGHGIGLEIHELPWVNAKNDMLLQENMVITIEPGLYFPGWGGIRIEDDVLVTKKGCEVLSRIPKSLKSMMLN